MSATTVSAATSLSEAVVRDYLARCHARCRRCGYSLHGLPSATCPECGTTHTLELIATGRQWPQQRRWSASKAIRIAGEARTTAAAAWLTLGVVGAVSGVAPAVWLCLAAGGWSIARRAELALRPVRVARMDAADRVVMADLAWIWAGLGVALLALLSLAAAATRGL